MKMMRDFSREIENCREMELKLGNERAFESRLCEEITMENEDVVRHKERLQNEIDFEISKHVKSENKFTMERDEFKDLTKRWDCEKIDMETKIQNLGENSELLRKELNRETLAAQHSNALECT